VREAATAILDSCELALRAHSPFLISRENVVLLSGEDEGVYGWLSVNSLAERLHGMRHASHGTLGLPRARARALLPRRPAASPLAVLSVCSPALCTSRLPLLVRLHTHTRMHAHILGAGALEVGGASTQITFAYHPRQQGQHGKAHAAHAPSPQAADVARRVVSVEVGGHAYRVYSHSYLGLGQDEVCVCVRALHLVSQRLSVCAHVVHCHAFIKYTYIHTLTLWARAGPGASSGP